MKKSAHRHNNSINNNKEWERKEGFGDITHHTNMTTMTSMTQDQKEKEYHRVYSVHCFFATERLESQNYGDQWVACSEKKILVVWWLIGICTVQDRTPSKIVWSARCIFSEQDTHPHPSPPPSRTKQQTDKVGKWWQNLLSIYHSHHRSDSYQSLKISSIKRDGKREREPRQVPRLLNAMCSGLWTEGTNNQKMSFGGRCVSCLNWMLQTFQNNTSVWTWQRIQALQW